jgi:two-component system KDP operon response regulator KdpE
MSTILIIDDEKAFSKALSIGLKASGYSVQCVYDAHSALKALTTFKPNIILLDLGLPDLDGKEFISTLRTWSEIPIVVLSARNNQEEKIKALDQGANDYITKPFHMGELLARIRAALRHNISEQNSPIISTDHFIIDLESKQICLSDKSTVRLTPTEWQILELLVINTDKVVTQTYMLQHVWGNGYDDEFAYLRVYIGRLRRKLEPDPSHPLYFITEPGMGYRFSIPHNIQS